MIKFNVLFAIIMIHLAANAGAQSIDDSTRTNESDWISYRDAYRTMIQFEKYGKAKNLIQNHFQIIPKDKSNQMENIRLTLVRKNTLLNLTLDSLGQINLPLLKSAYDENAEIKIHQVRGHVEYRSQLSIQIRPDGIYDLQELRNACAQTLSYLEYLNTSAVKGKKCLGIHIAFDKNESNSIVELRTDNQPARTLLFEEHAAIWPELSGNFRITKIKLDTYPEKGRIVTRSTPLIIVAVFE